ncbi:MAG: DoxX family protein [Bryobacteraceae bacterium]
MKPYRLADTAPWGVAALRITLGVVMFMHGFQKLFTYGLGGVAGSMEQFGLPLPMVSAVLITLTEFAGGALLMLGLLTRLAAVPVAFSMLVATLTVHLPHGFFLPGVEFTLTLAAAAAALALAGPGALAIDNRIFGRAAAGGKE